MAAAPSSCCGLPAASRGPGFPEIRGLYTTNGRWDVVAEIETATLTEFDDLLRTLRQIDGISTTETSILLAARKALR